MNIKIGAIIKRLRTENNITQEMLATAVGVTLQAISRWESEGGYPDIELLPSLADYFSVSTDELLGYKLSEREQALATLKKEMERLDEVGSPEERLRFARNALIRYPSDCEIKVNLAVCLYLTWENSPDDTLLTEAEQLCLSVLDACRDEATRYGAIDILISVYVAQKRSDKAQETVNLLAPMKYCREFTKSSGIGDGNTELYIQDEIDKLTDCLGIAIRNLVLNDDLPNDSSTWDKKITMLNVANDLYRMIYGDNLMFHHSRLAFNYWIISTYEIAQEKKDAALTSLESMAHHAVAYSVSYLQDHGKSFTSIFTDKLVYPEPGKDFHELKEHSYCYYMLEKLQAKRYDGIRDDARFIAVVKALQEHAE